MALSNKLNSANPSAAILPVKVLVTLEKLTISLPVSAPSISMVSAVTSVKLTVPSDKSKWKVPSLIATLFDKLSTVTPLRLTVAPPITSKLRLAA